MAITKNSDRQTVLTALVEVDFSMLTDGVAVEAVDVPANARVVGGWFRVNVIWDSATSDDLDIGDGGLVDRYSSTINPIDGVVGDTLEFTIAGAATAGGSGYVYTAADTIDLLWQGVGTAPTVGSGTLCVMYVIDGRSTETQT